MSYMLSSMPRFPANWPVVPFDEALDDVTGGNAKVQTRHYQPRGQVAVIDQGQSLIAGYVDDISFMCNVPLPCILFGDHTRIFKFVDHAFALGADGVKVLAPKPALNPRFAFHYLRSIRLPEDLGYSRHFKYLREALVPLPPLHEQRRIADILDKADSIRRKRKEAITLTEELLRSAFLEMFGDPVRNEKGWPQMPLKRLGRVTTGGTPPGGENEMFGGEIPFVTPGDLESGESAKRTLTEKGAQTVKTVRAGASLVCCIGATIGKMNRSSLRSAFNQQINAIEWYDQIDDAFGLAALRFLKGIIAESAASTTLPILKKSAFEQLQIIVPPKHLQCEFAKYEAQGETLRAHKQAYLETANNLFSSLVDRAFRGELTSPSTPSSPKRKQLGLFGD